MSPRDKDSKYNSATDAMRGSLTSPSKQKQNDPILQASSPDEIALVKFAVDMNTRLMERDRTTV